MSRSSSTERISEPSCSFWLRFCATSLLSSSRCTLSAARWKRLTVDQSRSSRSGSRRVSESVAISASKMSATAPAMALASGSGRGSGSSWNGRCPCSCSSVRTLSVGDDVCRDENSRSSRSVVMVSSFSDRPRATAAFTAIRRRRADRACTAERKRQRPEHSGGRRAAAILLRAAKPETCLSRRVGRIALRRRKIAAARRCGRGPLAVRSPS